MPERTDLSALIAGHTTVIEMINSGDTGLPVLTHLLRVARSALGAAGTAFVEFTPTGGRVIAATGAAEWAVGRPVPADDPTTVCLLSGARVRQVRTDGLTGRLAGELAERGLLRMVVSRAEIGGLTVGSMHALYPDSDDPPDVGQHAVVAYVASCIAHMYGDQTGLPVHGDGPVVAALADGLAVVDRDDHVRLWNPAAAQVTGRSTAQALNRPLPFPLPPPGQVHDHRLPDGRWLKITSGELPGPGGLRVVTFRDITDQQRRDHDRDLFVAVTSHELRTPVTVIKGYADTLTDHWESLTETDRRQAARVIGQRANELARLVDRLLSSATEAGPGDEPPAPYDLGDALRTAAADLPAELRQRLVLRIPADLPKALGHRLSLATILTELCTNAGKYSAPDSPIEITAEANGSTVSFQVGDRGIGIRPEHVERAFDRFWQGESGDRRRYPGAGLGLYLVRRIVEQQKGWVSLRPRAGGGTVAEVRLPRGMTGDGQWGREGAKVSTGAADRAWCVVVPHHAAGARLARRRLADELTDVVPPPLLADLVAVLAELVGNAVRHADPLPGGVVRVAWRLRDSAGGQQVQLRVTDGGAAAGPAIRVADTDAVDGRGLHIISGLADRWGVERDGLGQSVWAEFDPAEVTRPDLAVAG